MSSVRYSTTHLFGLSFFSGTLKELLAEIEGFFVQDARLHTICTPNPEQIVLAAESPEFKQALLAADLRIPDGVGVVLTSRLKSFLNHTDAGLTERITGTDLVAALIQQKRKMLVIGGRKYSDTSVPGTGGLPVYQLMESVFWTEGYAAVRTPTDSEEVSIQNVLEYVQPEVVCVAFGAPQQELWLQKNRTLLANSGVTVALCVGGAFDFILHKVPRAPSGVQQLGLEWLFRLWHEPWRWKRQLRLVRFMQLAADELLKR